MAAHMHRVNKRQARRRAQRYAFNERSFIEFKKIKERQLEFLNARFALLDELLPPFSVVREPQDLRVEGPDLPHTFRMALPPERRYIPAGDPQYDRACVEGHDILLHRLHVNADHDALRQSTHINLYTAQGRVAYYIADRALETDIPPRVIAEQLWRELRGRVKRERHAAQRMRRETD